jgi:hypothetical protein
MNDPDIGRHDGADTEKNDVARHQLSGWHLRR